jgi:hypothetical protein
MTKKDEIDQHLTGDQNKQISHQRFWTQQLHLTSAFWFLVSIKTTLSGCNAVFHAISWVLRSLMRPIVVWNVRNPTMPRMDISAGFVCLTPTSRPPPTAIHFDATRLLSTGFGMLPAFNSQEGVAHTVLLQLPDWQNTEVSFSNNFNRTVPQIHVLPKCVFNTDRQQQKRLSFSYMTRIYAFHTDKRSFKWNKKAQALWYLTLSRKNWISAAFRIITTVRWLHDLQY